MPCHANHVHRHLFVSVISVMETLLGAVSGADGAENKTIWALVWTRPEPAGHAAHLHYSRPGKSQTSV